jgi:epoxyqueuosine reductase
MPPLADLLVLDDGAFRKMFAGSPVRRAGHARFLRNVLVAAGNSNERALIPLVEALLSHDSALVRGMAVWAVRQLVDEKSYRALRSVHAAHEVDKLVLGEWG